MMRIAIPVTAENTKEAIRDIKRVEKIAYEDKDKSIEYLAELRIDYLKHPPCILDLSDLIKCSPISKIVTNRIEAEGGKYAGPEISRISDLQKAIEFGAEYIDIENSRFHKFKKNDKTKIIVSYHNFNETPENLEQIYKNIKGKNPDIVKIATKANFYHDNLRMLELIAKYSPFQNSIGICMGEEGKMTRVLGPAFGSYLTFACLEKKKGSAPGQMTVDELKQAWKLLGIK